jgi:hypothetical protein
MAICIALVCASCGREVEVEPLGVFAPSRLAHVLGQDGVAPVRFDDTLTLWTFGDTILGSWKGDVSAAATFSERAIISNMLSNSLAFSGTPSPESIGGIEFSYYTEKGKISPFIRNRPGENPARTRLWALDGIRLGGTVYVYYLDIRIDDPGKPMAFSLRGTGLARWDVPPGWKKGDAVDFRRRENLFGGDEPAFGGSVIEKDGFLYTVGQFSTKDFKSYARIARVPAGDIEKRSAYRFLAPGGCWTGNIRESLALFGDVSGECTLSYNAALRNYLIVYCKLFKGEIAVVPFADFRELDSPDVKTVYTPPALPRKGDRQEHFYYSGKEIFAEGRNIFVIYINPADYQPYLVRVKL